MNNDNKLKETDIKIVHVIILTTLLIFVTLILIIF